MADMDDTLTVPKPGATWIWTYWHALVLPAKAGAGSTRGTLLAALYWACTSLACSSGCLSGGVTGHALQYGGQVGLGTLKADTGLFVSQMTPSPNDDNGGAEG